MKIKQWHWALIWMVVAFVIYRISVAVRGRDDAEGKFSAGELYPIFTTSGDTIVIDDCAEPPIVITTPSGNTMLCYCCDDSTVMELSKKSGGGTTLDIKWDSTHKGFDVTVIGPTTTPTLSLTTKVDTTKPPWWTYIGRQGRRTQ